jgi:hypothetical protein
LYDLHGDVSILINQSRKEAEVTGVCAEGENSDEIKTKIEIRPRSIARSIVPLSRKKKKVTVINGTQV